MRILIFGINYSPELTGIGKYTGEMCAWLAEQGHEVVVVTALPYYPEWEVHSAYQGKRWMTEVLNGVTVYRVPLYVPHKVGSLQRIVHEFSFELGIFPVWFKLLLKRKFDVVMNIAPPFHLGFYAWIYARLKRAKLVSHIQDLQVDAAKDLGMIKNKVLLRLMFGMERFLLRQSDLVTSISEGMRKKILDKGIREEKFYLFPNWVDSRMIKPLPKEQSLRGEWNIPMSDKVILYAGNMGQKQGLDMVLDCAERFKTRTDLHFIIVGSGGMKLELIEMAEQKQLGNVRFFPLQPYAKVSALLATADIHLVLQKSSASDLVMPSKLTGILAAGGFAVLNAVEGSSLYVLVDKYQFGLLVEPESVEALIKGVENALQMDLDVMRNAARKYAMENLEKDRLLRLFEDKLLYVLSPNVTIKVNEKNLHHYNTNN